MPTNRTRITRSRVTEAPTETVYFLLTGELAPDAIDRFLNNRRNEHKSLWEKAKDTILENFIQQHPCCRPWGWWCFDAPRWNDSDTDCYWHGTLPEPRQRIGGSGRSLNETGSVPSFSFGLPSSWPTAVYADAGLAAVNDVPDPLDPPTFESQASYLQRHGLLTDAEKRWLKNHPEALQPEAIRI